MKVASKPVVPILHQVSINWREANFQSSASPSHRQNGATGSRRRPTASHKPHPRSACFHALISPAHHNPLRFSKSEFAAEDVVSVSLDRLPNLCSTWKAIFTQESESLPVPLWKGRQAGGLCIIGHAVDRSTAYADSLQLPDYKGEHSILPCRTVRCCTMPWNAASPPDYTLAWGFALAIIGQHRLEWSSTRLLEG